MTRVLLHTVNPVPVGPDNRQPVISSRYKSSDRPDHRGVDIMYKRLPKDGGAPGKNVLPTCSRRFFMPLGTPALAFADGVVRESRRIGTGEYVKIKHAEGLESQYMHLINRQVKAGDKVRAGQRIGTIHFNPDGFRLAHLHFQLRKNGVTIDPEPYLTGAGVMGSTGLLVKGLLAVAAGLLLSRYVFK